MHAVAVKTETAAAAARRCVYRELVGSPRGAVDGAVTTATNDAVDAVCGQQCRNACTKDITTNTVIIVPSQHRDGDQIRR